MRVNSNNKAACGGQVKDNLRKVLHCFLLVMSLCQNVTKRNESWTAGRSASQSLRQQFILVVMP